MDLEIRYLLHGQKQEYWNEKPLYIMSNTDNNNLWFKIADQVLSKNNESWRLINPQLAVNVPPTKYTHLKLESFSSENVIKLLKEEGANLIDANELSFSDRQTLLTEIGKDINNKDLWRLLPLHENTNGDLVSIKNFTYLENSRYPLNPKLKNIITLIKPNTKNPNLSDLQTRWINLWDSNSAMKVILNQPNPSNYTDLILNIWKSNKESQEFKQQYEERLKETFWLTLKTGKNIAPQNIIKLPNELAKYTRKIAELGSDYYCESYYSEEDLELSNYESNSIYKLFERWDHNTVIDILSSQESPSDYIEIIIDVLQIYCQKDNPNIPNQTLQYLRTKNWLITERGNSISPAQVIDVSKFKIEREATEILKSSDSDYITVEMLDSRIKQNETVLKWLKQELFITGIDALKIVGKSAGELPDYYLGEFNLSDFPLEDALEVFEGIDLDILPCWSLIEQLGKAHSNREDCKKYILPYLLQRIDNDKLIKLLNWISDYKGNNEIAIALYNQYLQESITENPHNFLQEILPNILLLNLANKWTSPETLSDYKPNSTADDFYIVNEPQYKIIEEYLSKKIDEEEIEYHNIDELQDYETQQDKYELLSNYFKNWNHVYPETIGSFLCLIMGNNLKLKELAQEYLGNTSIDIVLRALIPEKELINFLISTKSLTDNTIQLNSLTRKKFQAERKKELSHLCELNSLTNEITILPVHNPESKNKEELHQLLKKSIQELVEFYGCNQDIDKFWANLTKPEQLDIDVTRNIILRSVQYIIERLRVNKTNPKIGDIIEQLIQAEYELEGCKQYKQDYSFVSQKIDQLQEELAELLENDKEVASNILEAVRNEIALNGYNYTSIPFEIFQNADDAVVELEMMAKDEPSPQPLPENRFQFILKTENIISASGQKTNSAIVMMYWGRPINCHRHPLYRSNDYKKRGFDRDLQKMLSFNQSNKSHNFNDKNDDGKSEIKVTGKFGLGFKSVHLISKEPRILSHRLAFTIFGGLLPSRNILGLVRTELEKELQKYNPDFSDATIIKLPIDKNLNISSDNIINDFENLVSILLIFARQIKNCQFIRKNNYEENLYKEEQWKPQFFPNDIEQNIEIGQITINEHKTNVICIKLEDNDLTSDSGHLLIAFHQQQNQIKSSLTEDIPNIWVTAPTKEKLQLNFIVNAQFDVDTGRSTIREFQRNTEIAEKLGKLLGKQLCILFEYSQNDWDYFRSIFHLGNEITIYQFWEFIWKELVISLLNKPETGNYNLIRKVLLTQHKGIGYFLLNCPALPNGLSDQYQCLVSATEIKYIIDGILAKYFNQVFELIEVKNPFSKNVIINGKQWREFEKILDFNYPLPKLNAKPLLLIDILNHLIKNKEVKPEIANKIGKLINSNFLEEVKTNGKTEYEELIQWLQKVEFLNQENNYENTNQLLNINSKDNEEKLLSAFAPNEHILSDKYDEYGLAFFLACRQEEEKLSKNIKVDLLTEWIENIAEDLDEKSKVIQYILTLKYGELKTDLVEELCGKFDWIKNGTQIVNTTSIPETNTEIESLEGDEDDGIGNPKYGKTGEEKAIEYYYKYYEKVINCNDTHPENANPGFDLKCVQPKSPDTDLPNIKVEVKAITYDKPYIRITRTEWDFMIKNKDNYELFIYSHEHGKSVQLIRIKKAWLTIKKSLESLQDKQKQKLSYRLYGSKKIESVIGLQQNSEGSSNDILLHWHRLFRDFNDENIEKCYPKNNTFAKIKEENKT